MACISKTSYTMKADIYQPTITQDATGAVKKTWTLEKTIDCYARGIFRRGIGDNSTTLSITAYINEFKSMVKLRSDDSIPSDRRVVLIRNSSGTVFTEDQDPSSDGGFQGSTIYEPRGSTPMINFDGRVIEYETVLTRQEIQRMDV